jgi:hypothetical protein
LALQDVRTAGRSGGDGVSWQTEVAAAAAASDCSGKAGILEAPPADWGCVGEVVAPADGKSSDGSSDAGSGNAGHAAASSRRRVLMVSSTSTAV